VVVEGLPDEPLHVSGVHVEDETDLVGDVADAGQPGDGRFGGGALAGVLHRAGQREVAIPGGRLTPSGPAALAASALSAAVASVASSR
jgi:hypothetical protein